MNSLPTGRGAIHAQNLKSPALGKQVASLADEASVQEAFANPGPESWVGVNPRNLSAGEMGAEKEAQSEEAGSGAIPAQISEPAQLERDVRPYWLQSPEAYVAFMSSAEGAAMMQY